MKTIFENDNEGKPTKDLPKRKGRWVLGKENATIIKTLMLPKLICQPNMISAAAAAAAAKSLQLCQALCDSIDGSPPGSPVPGILQERTLEWVAISFSSGWKWKVKVKSLSRVRLFATPWTAAYQAPSPMGFSRQEYWSGLPLPSLNMITANTELSGPEE